MAVKLKRGTNSLLIYLASLRSKKKSKAVGVNKLDSILLHRKSKCTEFLADVPEIQLPKVISFYST